MSEAAVMRRSASACAYSKGLSVEPGWRIARTPSTSVARLSGPDEPTQASTSPLALSRTTSAPSSTCRPRSSSRWRCRVCSAKRWSGARRVDWIVAGTSPSAVRGALRTARWARCGAMPSVGSKDRRCRTAVVNMSSASQSGGCLGSIARMTSHARCATTAGRAFGARTREAATAASRTSSPWGALSNSVRDNASMPTSSPRNGTVFR